jgi:hypothetical protein
VFLEKALELFEGFLEDRTSGCAPFGPYKRKYYLQKSANYSGIEPKFAETTRQTGKIS